MAASVLFYCYYLFKHVPGIIRRLTKESLTESIFFKFGC